MTKNQTIVIEQKLECLNCGWILEGDYTEDWIYCPLCGYKKLQKKDRSIRLENL